MDNKTLEERISSLEEEVRELKIVNALVKDAFDRSGSKRISNIVALKLTPNECKAHNLNRMYRGSNSIKE